MVYLLAALMGFFAGNTAHIELRVRSGLKAGITNPMLAVLSTAGLFIGLAAILLSDFFVSAAANGGFLEGSYFALAALDGALLSWMFQLTAFSYYLSATTFLINSALAFVVYALT